MKILSIISIICLLSFVNCSDDSDLPDDLTMLRFEEVEIIGEIQVYDHNSNRVQSLTFVEPSEFFFSKERGVEPVDSVEFLSSNNALFYYYNDRFGELIYEAEYFKTNLELLFQIRPIIETVDTLKFLSQNDLFTRKAYGYKIKQPQDNLTTVTISGNGYGDFTNDFNINNYLNKMQSTDTLFVQEFNIIYSSE